MPHISTASGTILFNTRDELVRLKLERLAYFEADSNYTKAVFINGASAILLLSLMNIERILVEHFKCQQPVFVRIGRRHIVNTSFIFHINTLRQKLLLSDFTSANIHELSVSKEALRNLKELFIDKSNDTCKCTL